MKNKTPRGTKESVIAPENMKNRGAYPKQKIYGDGVIYKDRRCIT